jgi:hypothetical protein
LLFRKDLSAFAALIDFVDQLVIDQIVGEINAVEAKRKIVNALEVLVRAGIAQKILPDFIHSISSFESICLSAHSERSVSGTWLSLKASQVVSFCRL